MDANFVLCYNAGKHYYIAAAKENRECHYL